MDWKWVWLILLLVVIAAAVWLLLRRPGGSGEGTGGAVHSEPGAAAVPPAAADGDQFDAPTATDQPDTQSFYDQAADAPTAEATPGVYDDAAFDQAQQGAYDESQQEAYDQGGYDASTQGDAYAPTASEAEPQQGSYDYGADPQQEPVADAPFAAPTEAGDFAQEATYTDTATGETAEVGTVYEDPAVDIYEQPAVDAGYAEPTTDTGYTEPAADTGYAEPTTDTGYAEPAADTGYVEPAADTGHAEPTAPSGGDVAAAAVAGAVAGGGGTAAWAEQDEEEAGPTAYDTAAAPSADTTVGQGEPVQTAADFGVDDTATGAEAAYADPVAPVAEPVEPAPIQADAGDYGYDEAHAGAAAGAYGQGPFGAGSAEPAEDGSGPAGWSIKGNAGSMLFHTPESPSYEAARAEVWFESEEAAKAAGFAHWDRKQR